MEIRGKVYLRKRDVYHIFTTRRRGIEAFQALVNFSIPAKKTKLNDLVSILANLDRFDRYEWYTSHYELVGHRWMRKPDTQFGSE